jgi:formylglycine-generating enzyme required for sulfatase activity
MKKTIILMMVLTISLLSAVFMEINKTDGTTESIALAQIVSMNFIIGSGEYNEPVMLPVPAGNFQMGQVGVAEPVHSVTLTNDFHMGKYEIKNQEFCDMLNYALGEGLLSGDYENNVNVMNVSGDQQVLIALNYVYGCDISYVENNFVPDEGTENRPAICITWYGAAFYCNILSMQNEIAQLYNLSDWSCNVYPGATPGYRLPTEAEWEYAASYNDERTYTWGNEAPAPELAQFYYDGNPNAGHAVDVGTLPLGNSELGFCNMAGNAWEWCNDFAGNYSSDPQTNPTGSSYHLRRITRSGSWYDNPIHTLDALKAARRMDCDENQGENQQGFRIVRIGE